MLTSKVWLAALLVSRTALGLGCDPSMSLSVRMIDSIVSRGQGKEGSGASTSLIELGIFQSALRRSIDYHCPGKERCPQWSTYLQQSIASSIPSLLNASQDTFLPLDRLSVGNAMLFNHGSSYNATELTAIAALRESINLQPRNNLAGYWYYVYPNWSYLDGMYSFAPFYIHHTIRLAPENFTTVAQDLVLQLSLLWQHCRQDSSGLLVHGYDALKTAVWADPITGGSPIVWGRSQGWFLMALIDTLEMLHDVEHAEAWMLLHTCFVKLADAIARAADKERRAWWQVVDRPESHGNFIESSGSAMYIYALRKGVRLGYLHPRLALVAGKAYEYIIDNFVDVSANGSLSYNGTVAVCSLNSTATYEVSLVYRLRWYVTLRFRAVLCHSADHVQ